jgi:hypothetical protein
MSAIVPVSLQLVVGLLQDLNPSVKKTYVDNGKTWVHGLPYSAEDFMVFP